MYEQRDVLITGVNGLVGSELKQMMPDSIHISHKDYDLTNENDVKLMFYRHRPKCVVHLAAKVGGVLDNIKNPAIFFDENLLMNTFMLKHSYLSGAERFIGILSSCIFPDVAAEYPMDIDQLHVGPPTKTNFTYGYAKRCLAVQIDAYNQQYGTKYNYLVPSNMYGVHDKYDPKRAHFIPSLIVKIIEANKSGKSSIKLLGDGSPLRQFMHAKDLAYTIKYTIENGIYDNINVANDENLSIHEMAEIVLKATGNQHLTIEYEPNTPNGQHRKDICNKKLKELIPDLKFVRLEEGCVEIYNHIQKVFSDK